MAKRPKLHFHDTRLACWLLGIRSAAQLRAHPLRGVLFESWVASEILKQRVHRGESPPLFYYRDRHGAEADLVMAAGERIVPRLGDVAKNNKHYADSGRPSR